MRRLSMSSLSFELLALSPCDRKMLSSVNFAQVSGVETLRKQGKIFNKKTHGIKYPAPSNRLIFSSCSDERFTDSLEPVEGIKTYVSFLPSANQDILL